MIAEHTPEMTEEFIHADDDEWQKDETADKKPADEQQDQAETEPEGAEDEQDIPEEKAEVSVNVTTTIIGRDAMKLNAEIDDPDGREYRYQWQVSEDGGKNFTDLEDATGEELEVELTDGNMNYLWRVRVHAL